ncbi:hypothetical protein ANO14919_000470 [Xylariales sp. No.14919]|nr:hypothetical protein ANO14919_000470 [Xylariales sp. No.14919]
MAEAAQASASSALLVSAELGLLPASGEAAVVHAVYSGGTIQPSFRLAAFAREG